MEDKHKKNEMVRKLVVKRLNVEYVLQYSNVTPFMWYKGRYRCFYCAEPMRDPVLLREHTSAVHQFANLELVVFDRTKNNRNKDAAVKIDVTNLCCKLCTKSVSTLEQLIHHLIIAHDAEYDVSVPNCLLAFKLDKDQSTCAICNMKFVFFEYLLRHANKHHLAHDYICDVCGTSFQGENHLKMHNRYYHREGGYTCDYCGINLATLSKKSLHEKNVHMVNLSTCPHCPETFKSPYFKKLHLANVHGVEELKIKCPYCPKIYPQESIMSRHMRRVHLREKNVECQICGDKFFGPYDVKLHMFKHNGDKKFVCSICGKKFSNKSNLNSHSVVHTGKKLFVCTICSKEFTHRPNLKNHMRARHPDLTHRTTAEDENELEAIEFEKELNREARGGLGTYNNSVEVYDMDNRPLVAPTKPVTLTPKDKRRIIRNNVLQVLTKSTVMPFRWLKSSYRCFYCYDIFQDCSDLKNHQRVHIGDEIKEQAMNNYWEAVVYVDISNLACKLCPENINDLYDLVDHLVAKHDVVYNKDVGICMVAFKLDSFSLNCLACGTNFYTFGPLLHHTNKDHKGTSAILCDVCGQHFKNRNLLRSHARAVHENTGMLCPECGEKFETRSKLKTHQKNHHEMDKQYKCMLCTQEFQSHYKRSRHMATEHKNRQEIKCLHCPKTFVFRSMMMTHLRDTHLKVRNHVCGICGWKAFNSNRLKNHMYKHSGEKNFKCEACDKAFTTKKIMRAHFARMHKAMPPQLLQYENPYIGH